MKAQPIAAPNNMADTSARARHLSSRTTLAHSMSLEERTLVVRGVHQRVSRDLLRELFIQAGPVANVVLRADFAYIEFLDQQSVAYALALFDQICLFGQQLHLEPKLRRQENYQYVDAMQQFGHVMRRNPDFFRRLVDK